MTHIENSDDCDYCRGKGEYMLDGVTEVCFCVFEPLPGEVTGLSKSQFSRLRLKRLIKAKKAQRWRWCLEAKIAWGYPGDGQRLNQPED